MAERDGKKVYGLIIPTKGGTKKKALTANIFGSESDEEDAPVFGGKKPISKYKNLNDSKIRTKTQLEIEKALKDDPTVYEYDEVYDDMQEKRVAKSSVLLGIGKKEKKPRYIGNLIKAADDRKREHERRTERLVQKEREEEEKKGEFQDKEKFVTSAYKKKMLEMEKEAEEERHKEAIEAAMDVTNQKDMSGFYRHLLNQTTGEEAIPDNTKVKNEIKAEVKDEVKPEVKPDPDKRPKEALPLTEFPEDRDDAQSESSDSDHNKNNHSSERKKSVSKDSTSTKTSKHHQKRDVSKDPRRPSLSPESRHKKHRSRSPHKSRRSRSHDRGSKSRDKRSRSRDQDSKSHRGHRDRGRNRDRNGDQKSEKDRGRKARDNRAHRDEDKGRDQSREDEGKRSRKSRDKETKDPSPGGSQEKVASGAPSEEKTETATAPTDGPKPKAELSLAERFAKRNVGGAVSDARARYLARKKLQHVEVEKEED